jgi:hypothetical protein
MSTVMGAKKPKLYQDYIIFDLYREVILHLDVFYVEVASSPSPLVDLTPCPTLELG